MAARRRDGLGASGRRTALLLLVGALLVAPGGGPNEPAVVDPPDAAVVETAEVYVAVSVLAGETYEVWHTPPGGAATDVTAQFAFASADAGREIHHALLSASGIGVHEIEVIQHLSGGGGPVPGPLVTFTRAAGAAQVVETLADAGATIDGQRVAGALTRGASDAWLLFHEAALSGGATLSTAQAATTDADASDGLALTYYDEPSALQSVLPLATAPPGTNDEEEVWPTAVFERGSDVFALYARIDRDAASPVQGVGLANATGGALPFQRLTFPAAQPPGGGHFDDDFSLFQAGEVPLLRAAVVDGSDLLLYGVQEGASGLPEDREVVLLRAPLSTVEDPSTWEFWTEVTGVRAWRSSATGLVPLWTNSSAPSVAYNAYLGRWLATSTQAQGTIPPYAAESPASAVTLRVADDPRGPWSAPTVVFGLPTLDAAAEGRVLDATHVPAFDAGSDVYLVATNAADPALDPTAELLEVDLSAAGLPTGPPAPELTTASGGTTANPQPVTGYASPGATVTLYVNGVADGTATAAASDGAFTIDAVLLDGVNSVHATAEAGGVTSPASAAISLDYTNTIPRTQSGTISQDTVWTEDTTGPYVITDNLTVASGVRLVLQPGAELRFASSKLLTVDGTLEVRGDALDAVTLTSDLASPAANSWQGVRVNSGGVLRMTGAVLAYATNPFNLIGADFEITDSTIHTFMNRGIWARTGSTGLVRGVTLQNPNGGFNSYGIFLDSAGFVEIDQTVVEEAGYGLWIYRSSPLVTASRFEANTKYGVHVARESAPELTGNQILSNAQRGLSLAGANNVALDPTPLFSGNDVVANGAYDVYTASFGSPETTILPLTGNWWGTTDLQAIADRIEDHSDNAQLPTVAFGPPLNASVLAGGFPLPGAYLTGPLTGSLSAGPVYTATGSLLVASSSSLTLQAGVELRFLRDTELRAAGTLRVLGSTTTPVLLRSAAATPAPGDWTGLVFEAGSDGSLVRHALVDHAEEAVHVEDAAVTVRDSSVREFGSTGISLRNAGATIEGNTLVHGSPTANTVGVQIDDPAETTAIPVISGNTLSGVGDGLRIAGPTSGAAHEPQVTGNWIENNSQAGVHLSRATNAVLSGNRIRGNGQYGVYVGASGNLATAPDPAPVVTGNDIHGNGTGAGRDLWVTNGWPTGVDPATVVIDASGNWWGTASVAAIAAQVHDHADASTSAVARFTPFLDASIDAGGAPVAGEYLFGPTAPGTVLTTGTTYDVVSAVTVPAGETLTIEDGATLRFLDGLSLTVDGAVDIGGATLTTATAPATRGAWQGLVFSSSSSGSVIDSARIEWAVDGIYVDGADVTVRNAEIVEFSGTGVELRNGAGGLFEDNLVDNGIKRWGFELVDSSPTLRGNTVRNMSVGIDLVRSSPQILGNLVELNDTGVEINNDSHPLIASGNVIANNTNRGIQIVGVFSNPAKDPAPVIQGNEIRDNNVHLANRYNLRAQSYGDPTVHIDATGNYWGSVDAGEIAGWIWDQTDSSGSPTVDFAPYTDAAGQPVGGGNLLNGTLAANTTLAMGTSWQMVGTVTVPAGVTLTVEEGVDLTVVPGAALLVDGTLDLQGTAGSPVVMRSSQATPTPGAWDGIAIRSTSTGSVLDHAEIRHAHRAVVVEGVASAVTLSNLTITDFGRPGDPVEGAGIAVDFATVHVSQCDLLNASGHADRVVYGIEYRDAGGSIAATTVDGTDRGLHLLRSSPSVQGSTFQGSAIGIHVAAGSSPTVDAGNVVTGNEVGIRVLGNRNVAQDPLPVIQGNDIHGNDTGAAGLRNLEASDFGDPDGTLLNATGNWWGTTDPLAIAGGITDLTDWSVDAARPSVDFTPFLDASVSAGGSAVAGSFLNGILSGSTNLSASTTYDVVGTLLVPTGSTLTIPDGATLRVVAGGAVRVAGTLQVQGTAGSPVLFTSAEASPAAGDWRGIVLEAGSSGSVIDHAVIEWATQAVQAHGVDFTLSNSTLRDFSQIGVYAEGATAASSIDGNTIRGTTLLGTGIYLVDASPAITGNDIQDAQVGIFLTGISHPQVNSGNTITANAIGLQLQGGRSAATNPAPVVTGNSIFENRNSPQSPLRNVQVFGYFYEGIDQVLDFTGNWWGTTVASEVLAGIDQSLDIQPTSVDVSGFLDAAGGSAVGGAVVANPISNVSHSAVTFAPSRGDQVWISFDLAVPADVTLQLYLENDDALANPVRTTVPVGLPAGPNSLSWDGRDDGGNFVPDDAYAYVLTATAVSSVGVYNPPRSQNPNPVGPTPTIDWTPDTTFSAHSNEFWKADITVGGDEARVVLRGEKNKGSVLNFDILDKAFPMGTHQLIWDGRDGAGQLLEGTWSIYLAAVDSRFMKPNHVIVEGGSPEVRGAAPYVEVKSDPWLIQASYDQISNLRYTLDQDCTVTVKMLPPGVVDPGDPGAVVLVADQLQQALDGGGQPLVHEVPWVPTDPSDANAVRIAEKGTYTFTIEATSQASGFTTLYRGVIQMRP